MVRKPKRAFGALTHLLTRRTARHTDAAEVGHSNAGNGKLEELLLSMTPPPAGVKKTKRKSSVEPKLSKDVSLVVVGTGAKGSPASVCLFTDDSRYLFNCGEGTQRLLEAYQIGFSNMRNVFVTSKEWSKVGGLPGFLLTVQEKWPDKISSSEKKVSLYGPRGLGILLSSTNRFLSISQQTVLVDVPDCITEPYFENPDLKINFVSVERTRGEAKESLAEERLSESGENCALFTDRGQSMSYICRHKRGQLTFRHSKCIALGVPSGEFIQQLKAGQDVILPSGKKVLSDSVHSTTDRSSVFMIVDCPTEDHLENFVSHHAWENYQMGGSNSPNENLVLVVHFTPTNIILDSRYQTWMKRFKLQPKHLVVNQSNTSEGYEFVHQIQYKLNFFDTEMFPMLESGNRLRSSLLIHDDSFGWRPKPRRSDYELLTELAVPKNFGHSLLPLVPGQPLLKFHIKPSLSRFDESRVVGMCKEDYIKEVLSQSGFQEELAKYKEKARKLQLTHQEFPKMSILGSGSSVPMKSRNVSGILINICDSKRILLDCGEGTWGQLFRLYGESNVYKIMTELKAIYISHLHTDHHMGLIQILLQRQKCFQYQNIPFEPLTLFAPHQIMPWLKAFHYNFEEILHLFQLVSNSSLLPEFYQDGVPHQAQDIFDYLELELKTCNVNHFKNATGVVLKHKSGWKICYSGDTLPCDTLIELGQNADVCIHEATYEDGLADVALTRKHSTFSQAIQAGKDMNAKNILLTHFSNRYSKIPIFPSDLPLNVGFAFDNMLARLTDLPKISLMYNALKCLFQEHVEEVQFKSQRRIRNQKPNKPIKMNKQ